MTRAPTRKMLTPVAATRMQMALQTKPQSLDDLVVVSGLAKPTVTRYIKEMQVVALVHVGGWARDTRGYPTIRQFSWGALPDADCPKNARSGADRMRALRATRKAVAA